MSYHTVFDISDRFPDAVIGLVALAGVVAFLVLSSRRYWRGPLSKTSWLWLGAGGILWALFQIHNTGIPSGLLFGGIGAAIAFLLAGLAWRDLELPTRDGSHVRARSVAPVAAIAVLAATALLGCWQLSSFDLAGHLAAGDATVVTGTVEDAGGGNWAYECFSVSGHRYCYNDSASSVGFHQSAANGGPIHDGLEVRVSSIGDVIVQLEIADGQ